MEEAKARIEGDQVKTRDVRSREGNGGCGVGCTQRVQATTDAWGVDERVLSSLTRKNSKFGQIEKVCLAEIFS